MWSDRLGRFLASSPVSAPILFCLVLFVAVGNGCLGLGVVSFVPSVILGLYFACLSTDKELKGSFCHVTID